MNKWILYLLLLLLSLGACKRGEEKSNIPRKDLIHILADMHITDAIALHHSINEQFGGLDSSLLYQTVLDKYGYTKEELVRSLRQHCSNPEKLIKVYDDVFSILSKKSEETKELYSATSAFRSHSIWKPDKTRFNVHGDTATYPPVFDVEIDTTGTFILSAEIKIAPRDSSVNPRIMAYFYNPENDLNEERVYFNETLLHKSNHMREYTLLKDCHDHKLSRLRIVIPMHDTPDSMFNKAFDMQNLRVSLFSPEKK